MNITSEEYSLAKRQAARIARKWKAADREDIEGDLMLWLVENYRHVERYRDEPGGRNKLAKALYRHGLGKATKEQEAANGRRLVDEWAPYTKKEIRAALPFVWDTQDIPSVSAVTHPRSGAMLGTPSRSDVETAMHIILDMRAALEHLSDTHKRVLYLKYHEGMTNLEAAREMNMSPGMVSRRVWDAIERMHAKLAEARYTS